MTNSLDNASIPSIASETFLPDQLIAGDAPRLVTDQGSVLTGGALLQRGTVLGKVTVGAAAAAVAGGGNTGNGTITVPVAGVKAKVGVYTIRFTGATAFNVINPNGVELTPGVAVGAYADPEIGFTFTAGGTAMVAGDSFTINIPAGSGKYKQSVATAIDGSQNPCGILADIADASGGDVGCAVYLSGSFNSHRLTFDASWSVATLAPVLQPLQIYLRTSMINDPPT